MTDDAPEPQSLPVVTLIIELRPDMIFAGTLTVRSQGQIRVEGMPLGELYERITDAGKAALNRAIAGGFGASEAPEPETDAQPDELVARLFAAFGEMKEGA